MKTPALRILVSAALALLGSSLGAQKGSFGVRAETAAILAHIEAWSQVAPGRDELVRLGPAAIPELFACLVAGEVPGPDGDVLTLSTLQRATLTTAVGSFPRSEVLGFLGRVAHADSGEPEREAALRLLARLGEKRDLKLVLGLGSPVDEDEPASPELRAAFEGALSGIAARDPDALLLLEIGDLGKKLALWPDLTGPEPDLALLEKVRGYLGHPDAKLAVLACTAIQKLADASAAPDLIALLDAADPSVRREAHRALAKLTGLAFEADSASWLAWLDAELTWWDADAEACRLALLEGQASEAAAALQAIGQKHLFPARSAELLLLASTRPEPDLVRLACTMLGALHTRAAIPELIQALGHADPGVASSAWGSLKKLTGLSLPLDEHAWRAHLLPEE